MSVSGVNYLKYDVRVVMKTLRKNRHGSIQNCVRVVRRIITNIAFTNKTLNLNPMHYDLVEA
jgi:hypothetical protein